MFSLDGYGNGCMYCFWMRWHSDEQRQNKWVVILANSRFPTATSLPRMYAVIDDFGFLVEVPR